MSCMLLMRMTSFCISNGLLSQLDHKGCSIMLLCLYALVSLRFCVSEIQNFCNHHTNSKLFLVILAVTCFPRINYLLAGGLHPIGFHMLNVALHCVISVLMIDVFAILIGGLVHDGRGAKLNLCPKASFLAALFFAAHPVHTESVSRVGRRDSAGCLCPVNNH